ncbi:Gfo/Idh/MocA family protein [Streptococcus sp. H49]|uniref:Gfo/Idh/MocA family protein n=1 Tax=Streptococcus huangxiaojuni TaxID=3237239 RepID=UPI0034A0F250
MLNIGIVGLGGIAQKAYLPYMRQLSGIYWHLFTRKEKVLEETSALFGQAKGYDSLEELARAPLDGVFVHAATEAHRTIAELFLKRSIPVYMDKPLTESYETSKALYDLAAKNGTFLMAGFNRRFAPRIAEMKTVSNKTQIIASKNDVNAPADFQYKLFDLFIHPLDTVLFLMDQQPVSGYFSCKKQDDKLIQVKVILESKAEFAEASMNLQAGSRKENIEIQCPQGTYSLVNLTELSIYQGDEIYSKAFGSWASTLYKRGFEGAVDSFLQVLKDCKEGVKVFDNPVKEKSSLLSHWICDQINKSTSSSGNLSVVLPK